MGKPNLGRVFNYRRRCWYDIRLPSST